MLENEKEYNVFMRCRESALQEIVSGQAGDAVNTMTILRNWKNTGNKL